MQDRVDAASLHRLIEPDWPAQQSEDGGTSWVSWSAWPDRGPLGEALLRLQVEASLLVRCERCLGPLRLDVESATALHIVASEAELADGSATEPGDDEGATQAEFDKVLGSRHFDLVEQVEDELILCVPYVPKHEVCPGDAPLAAKAGTAGPAAGSQQAKSAKPSPFAVLAQLKGGQKDSGPSES